MKKKLLILTALTFLLTGCGKKVELNLDKIKEDVQNLKSESFSYNEAIRILDEEYNDYEQIYETDDMGLTYDLAETIYYKKNETLNSEIFVIKPIKSKTKEIKTIMDKHFKTSEKLVFKEIDGTLFYINTDNSKNIIESIKKAKGNVFSMLIEIPKADMENLLEIKESWVEESLIMTPAVIVNSNLYMVVKPVKGEEEKVKKAIDKYMDSKEEEWKTYLPDQYELFKSRKFEKYGDYLIYIASTDNSKVLDIIKKGEK